MKMKQNSADFTWKTYISASELVWRIFRC